MFLSKLSIKNYRLLKDVEISLDSSLTLFVGKNNSGKTSVMQLVQSVLVDPRPVLRFDDYPLVSRQLLYDAIHCVWNEEIDIETFKKEVDVTGIRFYIDYTEESEDENLGGLSPFIIDLDDKVTEAIIDFKFVITPQIENLLQTMQSEYSLIATGKDSPDSVLAETVKKHFSDLFIPLLVALNPSAEEDYQERSLNQLKQLIFLRTISAERNLDESERDNPKPLSAIMSRIFAPNKEKVDDSLKSAMEHLANQIEIANFNTQEQINLEMNSIANSMLSFGYPTAEDLVLKATTSLSLKNQIINNTDLFYISKDELESLPSTHNGLGYKNLIKMSLVLSEFANEVQKDQKRIPLLYIEEPEAHMHPQLQAMFVKYVRDFLKKTIGGDRVQLLITTHAAHVANTVSFNNVRYMRRYKNFVVCKNLCSFYEDAANSEVKADNMQFLQKYLKLSYCDLYFCDKAILVEGAAERLIIPDMIRKCDNSGKFMTKPSLAHQYYSIIEVGGAYAHRFYDFIDFLEIPTLILTDIDFAKNGKKCQKEDATSSSNGAINNWCHDVFNIAVSKSIKIDSVLKLLEDEKKRINGHRRIEFQHEQNDAHPRSLEEAIINVNRDLFGRDADAKVITFDEDDDGIKKTDFALQLLVEDKFSNYEVPSYIEEGLIWLDAQSKVPEQVIPIRKLKRGVK